MERGAWAGRARWALKTSQCSAAACLAGGARRPAAIVFVFVAQGSPFTANASARDRSYSIQHQQQIVVTPQ